MKNCEAMCDKPATTEWRGKWYCDEHAEATDSTRRLIRATRNKAQDWQRIKPDPEVNPLVELDCEKVPTWDERTPQATPLLSEVDSHSSSSVPAFTRSW